MSLTFITFVLNLIQKEVDNLCKTGKIVDLDLRLLEIGDIIYVQRFSSLVVIVPFSQSRIVLFTYRVSILRE